MTNTILNDSGQGNYVTNDSIFILDAFANKTTYELIGRMHNMIHNLPQTKIYSANKKITSPYNIDGLRNPVIDVYISSNGGDGDVLYNISCLLGVAKSRGAIIRTTVLSHAASCGSLLAIQGTPGFRIMYSKSVHFIHFGTHKINIRSESEIDIAAHNIKQFSTAINNLYLTHTKLTTDILRRIQSNEQGYLDAQQSLQYGLCDWVIDECGNISKQINTKTR